VSALLALALAAAPGCPAAVAAAAGPPEDLASRAPAIVASLEAAGAGGPTVAVASAARAIAAAGADARAGEAAVAAFRGALARHCALAAAPAAPEASAADRAALAEILARPELAGARGDPYALRRALVRLWDWIVDLLGTEEAERYASLGRALFLGVAAAAVLLAAAALRRRRRGRTAGAGPVPDAAAPGVRPDGGESAALAEEALRRGETRAAVRLGLLAALAALERAGRIPRGRALTNGEVVAAAAFPSVRPELVEGRTATAAPTAIATPTSTPTSTATLPFVLSLSKDEPCSPTATPTPAGGANLASDLALLVRAFDRAVYGGLPVAPEEAGAAVERARRICSAAGGLP
jgi:hypothetical protein